MKEHILGTGSGPDNNIMKLYEEIFNIQMREDIIIRNRSAVSEEQ
jgi:hypothetical protein